MRLEISRSTLDAIHLAAAADPTREICGLLLGADDQVHAWRQVDNVAEDNGCRFEIDPAALFGALRAERAGGPALIGYVHSHPNGIAAPSVADAEAAQPDGRYWLIVAAGQAGAWQAIDGGACHGRFEPVDLDICAVATN